VREQRGKREKSQQRASGTKLYRKPMQRKRRNYQWGDHQDERRCGRKVVSRQGRSDLQEQGSANHGIAIKSTGYG